MPSPLLLALIAGRPSPSPSPSPAGCRPGVDGIPDSGYGSLMCGTWATGLPATLARWWHTHSTAVITVALIVVAARIVWPLMRRLAWNRHAAKATWLQIVPPVTATPAATENLWRLLAGLLPAPRPWTLRPARLIWEVDASPSGMRCGIWVPPGINPTAVTRVLHRAWPGARVEHTSAPAPRAGLAHYGYALTVLQPEYLPLLEHRPARTSWSVGITRPDTDQLRAVYDGLAAAGRTGAGILQVIVGRAPARRVGVLNRAAINPANAVRPHGAARAGLLALRGLSAVLTTILDLVTPSTSGRATRNNSALRPVDPYRAELARAARSKLADTPHLLIQVRALGAGPTKAAARAAAADITSGYAIVSHHLGRRPLRRPTRTLATRWAKPERMCLSTVADAAALAGLPAEPSAHGLPSAASQRRGAHGQAWQADPHPNGPDMPGAERHTAPPPSDLDDTFDIPWEDS